MATRELDAEDVRSIFKTDLDNADITVCLNVAKLLVAEDLADSDLSAARLDEITRNLAAHFCTANDKTGRLTSLQIDDVRQTYAGTYGAGLLSSQYGQTAVMLDTSGVLAALAEPMKPTASTAIHYIDYDTDTFQ